MDAERLRAPTDILRMIGGTPLLRIARLSGLPRGVEIHAKAEWFNPGGSVKDRAALNMVVEAERTRALRPGKTILDATSGNTGIALAMLGAAKGYPVRLCIAENASIERKRILKAYGAEIVYTSPFEGSDGAQREARRLYDADPERYFYVDQYSNPANWQAHYYGTAPEIWEQTAGRVTHFVAGLGTSGTFVGTARRLREFNPAIRMISFQPDSPLHGLEGMKHMATAIVPKIYDPTVADEDRAIGDEAARTLTQRLGREEGLLVGISYGAALACALGVARELTAGVVVTVFPDGGDKYLSGPVWEE
jgi:S-sulfo-L-cysteine synthase (O-acetyl-L-serine-dependent)